MLKDKEWRCAFKFVLAAAAIYILIQVILKLVPILGMLAIAVLIVYCLAPFVNFMIKKRIHPFLASTITTAAIILAVIIFFYLILPGLIAELRQLTIIATTDYYQELLKGIHGLEERFGFQFTKVFFNYMSEFISEIPPIPRAC